METVCIVELPLLLLKFLVFFATCFIILINDLSEEKEKLDAQRAKFSFLKDYWAYRWDNIAKKWAWGFLGALVSGEVGMYFLEQMIDLPEYLEAGLDLTVIAASTFGAQKIFAKQ